jgi:hypothetical protein
MSPIPPPIVTCSREPSDTAWRHFGDVAARILENLAERDLRAAAALDRTSTDHRNQP